MTINKSKGNMYPFVSHTWNVIKGICPHDCPYCYMKVYPQKALHFDMKELKTDLGKDNFIFVGSSCDMFAKEVQFTWINDVLRYCKKFDNKYLFQTKNPERFAIFDFPKNTIFGITLETDNHFLDMGNAPNPTKRVKEFVKIKGEKMVTIEPIIRFNLSVLIDMIKAIKPKWVNIGADSKGHGLQEPSEEEIKELIKELKRFTEVKIKKNLARLCPSGK